MKEIKTIIRAYEETADSGIQLALATVVHVEGSSYRRTGARMLVMDNGSWVGGISGGCLEGDALKRARLAIQNASASRITYDTSEDDPYQIGVGLGCNGVIDVLFTPLDRNDPANPVQMLKQCLDNGRKTHLLLTVTSSSHSDRLRPGTVVSWVGEESADHFPAECRRELLRTVGEQLAKGHSALRELRADNAAGLELFIEIIPPEIHLVIMGHQYDVYPLARLAREMDWHLSIIANPLKVNPLVATLADQVVAPEHFPGELVDRHTAIILMAHDYKTDKANLVRTLRTPARYIGMLGPRLRSEKIWDELQLEGRALSAYDFSRVYAPVGLDIGAVTPEEISLSLLAEVKAVFSGRPGNYLRLRRTAINERT